MLCIDTYNFPFSNSGYVSILGAPVFILLDFCTPHNSLGLTLCVHFCETDVLCTARPARRQVVQCKRQARTHAQQSIQICTGHRLCALLRCANARARKTQFQASRYGRTRLQSWRALIFAHMCISPTSFDLIFNVAKIAAWRCLQVLT